MSQLRVSGINQPDFYLNVVSFDSPISGEIRGVQTKSQVQYFPIKAFQPDLVCSVVFPSERVWEQWQEWARTNMVNSQKSNASGMPGVTLNWPERNINNWTGIIPSTKAGGMRYNYTPRTQVEFQLVVSLVSNLQVFQSFASNWQGLFQSTAVGSNVDTLFTLAENFIGGAITQGNAALFGAVQTTLGSNLLAGNTASIIPGITQALTGGIPF